MHSPAAKPAAQPSRDRVGELEKRVATLEKEIREDNIEMVVIAVPATVAQIMVDDVVAAGAKAILNFAPVNLRVPDDVHLRNENMSMELEYLSFALVNNHTPKRVR